MINGHINVPPGSDNDPNNDCNILPDLCSSCDKRDIKRECERLLLLQFGEDVVNLVTYEELLDKLIAEYELCNWCKREESMDI